MEKTKFTDYNAGDIILGKKSKHIYSATETYIVYTLKSDPHMLHYTYSDSIISPLSLISAKVVEIDSTISRLYSKKRYVGLKAKAYIECFEGKPQNGLDILNQIKSLADKDFNHQIKITYLLWTLALILFNTAVCLFLYYTKDQVDYGPFYQYYIIATFGSFGGFLSTINKINKLDFKEEDSKVLLIFLAISRIFLSMLASIVIYVLIKSNILLGILNNVENVYVFYIFSVAAGFSETFIPDILKRIQKSAINEN